MKKIELHKSIAQEITRANEKYNDIRRELLMHKVLLKAICRKCVRDDKDHNGFGKCDCNVQDLLDAIIEVLRG